jgi:hypothetical protein
MIVRLRLAIVLAVALCVDDLLAMPNWNHSEGGRAGWLQKRSKKGWICKTWEGGLAPVSLPGSSVEKFLFTVRDDALAARIMQVMGKRMTLHHEEKVGLPTSCFGETRHFVTGVTPTGDIPLAPGITIPSPGEPPASPAPAH